MMLTEKEAAEKLCPLLKSNCVASKCMFWAPGADSLRPAISVQQAMFLTVASVAPKIQKWEVEVVKQRRKGPFAGRYTYTWPGPERVYRSEAGDPRYSVGEMQWMKWLDTHGYLASEKILEQELREQFGLIGRVTTRSGNRYRLGFMPDENIALASVNLSIGNCKFMLGGP